MCANDQVLCHEEYCPYARDYFVKLRSSGVVQRLLETWADVMPDVVFAEAKEAGRRVAPGVRFYLQYGSEDVERYARERGHAVGHQERVAIAQRGAELGEQVLDTRRGLGMDHGDHAGMGMAVDRLHQCVVRDALPPIRVHRHNMGVVPARDLGDSPPEEPAQPEEHRDDA